MSLKEFQEEHFPKLDQFFKAAIVLKIEQIIEVLGDEELQQELHDAYFNSLEQNQDHRELRKEFADKVGVFFGDLCARSIEITECIFFDEEMNGEGADRLRSMVRFNTSSSIRARIFRHYGDANDEQKEVWSKKFWKWWHEGLLKSYFKEEGNEKKRDENIGFLCEVEGTAAFVLDDIFSKYTPLIGGFAKNAWRQVKARKKHDIKLSTLVEVVKKWPKLAYKLANAVTKCDEDIDTISCLRDLVIASAKEGHAPSILTFANIKFVEALNDKVLDIKEVLDWCEKYKEKGDQETYYQLLKQFADLLSGQKSPESILDFCLKGLKEEGRVLRLETAYQLYEKVRKGTKDEKLARAVRIQLNDPQYRNQMAEYYHSIFAFKKAQLFYNGVLEDAQKVVDVQHMVISSLPPVYGQSKKEKLRKLTTFEKKIVEIGREAKLRVALLWSDRLSAFNKDPNLEPELCFEFATIFLHKEKYAEAFRLFSLVSKEDSLFNASQSQLKLLKPYKKDFEEEENYLPKLEQVEFLLPHYKNAAEAGHEEALVPIEKMEKELEELLKGKPGGYKPTFVDNLGQEDTSKRKVLQVNQF